MIEQTVEQLTPIIGTRPACRALGAAPATIYRRRRPPAPRPARPRPVPARALSDAERAAVLAELHSERFADSSPGAGLGDAARRGPLPGLGAHDVPAAGRRARPRPRAPRPAHASRLRASPSCSPSARTRSTRWDITKLLGPAKWTYYYLYVILDVFSRYAVGWTVQHRENGHVAKDLIAQVCEQQQIQPATLTVHADRGSSMTSKPVAFLLGRPRRHQDPQPALHLHRQPLQRGAVQDAQVPARLPAAL